MEMTGSQKFKICMLLPLHYEPDMLIYPRLKIFSYLTNFGHSVDWIISSEEENSKMEYMLGDIKVKCIPRHRYFSNHSILADGFNEIFYTLRRIRVISSLFKINKYDLVFVRQGAKRPFDGLIGTYLKWKHRVVFVVDLPVSLDQLGVANKTEKRKLKPIYSLIALISKSLADLVIRKSDLVLPVSHYLKNYLIEHGVPESKVFAIPAGVDPGETSKDNSKTIVDKYGLQNSRIVIYQGTLDKIRQIGILLQAFSIVKKTIGNARLLIVGDGTNKNDLMKLSFELGIQDDVIFTGKVAQSEVAGFIDASNIGVSPIPPLDIFLISSPIKLLEYMALSKPVVANIEIPEHKDVCETSGGGILVEYNSQAFAKGMIDLLENPQKAIEMGKKGREWVVHNRSYEILARQVEAAYFRLLMNSEGGSDSE